MKAVILCAGPNGALLGMDEHQPAAMLPLGDRPFLQHVVEQVVLNGARECDFILTYLPAKIEDYFGDGSRWGCRFTYHLAAGVDHAWRVLRNVCAGYQGTVLLAQADALPVADDLDKILLSQNVIMSTNPGSRSSWSGWATFAAASASRLFPDLPTAAMGDHLQSLVAKGEIAAATIDLWVNCRTPEGILESQHLLIAGNAPKLMLNGNKAEKGICIGHGASIHPTAILQAPLYIGANSRIGARASVGPNAVVSENCIVDDETTMLNSMITPGTYIGQGLEMDGVIVDRNRLVNSRLGTACLISESFLAGSLAGPRAVPFLRGLADRVIALVLYFLTLPILAFMYLRARLGSDMKITAEAFVALPSADDPRQFSTHTRTVFRGSDGASTGWKHFTREFVPGLISVFRGQLNLVGVPPRSASSIQNLPEDWRSVYVSCKAGLITEALIVYGANPRFEEAYSADAFYRAMESPRYDGRLLLRYLWQIFFKRRTHGPAELAVNCEAE